MDIIGNDNKKLKIFIILFSFFVINYILFSPQIVFADTTSFFGFDTSSPQGYINSVYRYGLILISFLSAAGIVYGGIRYLTSAGNEEAIQSGKQAIFAALSGLILVLLSHMILRTLDPRLVELRLNIPSVNLPDVSDPQGDGTSTGSGGSSDPCASVSEERLFDTEADCQSRGGEGNEQCGGSCIQSPTQSSSSTDTEDSQTENSGGEGSQSGDGDSEQDQPQSSRAGKWCCITGGPAVFCSVSTVRGTEYDDLINAAAQQYGLDAHYFRAHMQRESGLDPGGGPSSTGDFGIIQFQPDTATTYYPSGVPSSCTNAISGSAYHNNSRNAGFCKSGGTRPRDSECCQSSGVCALWSEECMEWMRSHPAEQIQMAARYVQGLFSSAGGDYSLVWGEAMYGSRGCQQNLDRCRGSEIRRGNITTCTNIRQSCEQAGGTFNPGFCSNFL